MNDITERVQKVKKSKAAVAKKEKKPIPAGAQGGAVANTDKDEVTSGLKAILKTQKGKGSE